MQVNYKNDISLNTVANPLQVDDDRTRMALRLQKLFEPKGAWDFQAPSNPLPFRKIG
jgi:hypothetical protein